MARKPINDYDRIIGQRVIEKRKPAGISQERLGFALGVTFQQVQKMEKGVNRIGAGRLVDIARALHVPVTSFYAGMDDGSEISTESALSGQAIDLAKLFDELPAETRVVMFPTLRAMLRANLHQAAA